MTKTEAKMTYDPSNEPETMVALQLLKDRLGINLDDDNKDIHSLSVRSMRATYSLSWLCRYYNEHMLPNFPLEHERDALEDWIEALDPNKRDDENDDNEEGRVEMDLLLLTMKGRYVTNDKDKDIEKRNDNNNYYYKGNHNDYGDNDENELLVAGIAIELYVSSRVGLVSYVTVCPRFRGRGVLSAFHPVAVAALHTLSVLLWKSPPQQQPLRAVLAETNTVEALDLSPDNHRRRHAILRALGYRMLDVPYVQPPLVEPLLNFVATDSEDDNDNDDNNNNNDDDGCFREIVLLIYNPTASSDVDSTATVPASIVLDYVTDFYASVYRYNDDNDNDHNKNKIFQKGLGGWRDRMKAHWYHRLLTGFVAEHPRLKVVDLPWNDPLTNELVKHYTDTDSTDNKTTTVVVVGGGVAGLTVAWKLASFQSDAHAQSRALTQRYRVMLLEKEPWLGGRVRTVVPNDEHSDGYEDVLENKNKCSDFFGAYGWTVPLGAEFVHGVNSIINDLSVQHQWPVEETFDLSPANDVYNNDAKQDFVSCVPFRALLSLSSIRVQIWGDGACWDLLHTINTTKESSMDRYPRAIRVARELWDHMTTSISPSLADMSLSEYVTDYCRRDNNNKMNKMDVGEVDVSLVVDIVDALYATTHATSPHKMGVQEAAREEHEWEYTECNFRLQHSYAELVRQLRNECLQPQAQPQQENGNNNHNNNHINKNGVTIHRNCHVNAVRRGRRSSNSPGKNDQVWNVCCADNRTFACDVVVMAVPLDVLKQGTIVFRDENDRNIVTEEKQRAIETVNMHGAVKAFALFREFAEGDDDDDDNDPNPLFVCQATAHTELLFCPSLRFPQLWFRRSPDRRTMLVTGFAALVEEGSHLLAPDENDLLRQLATVTKVSSVDVLRRTLVAATHHVWPAAYSSPTVGATRDDRRQLASPLCHEPQPQQEHGRKHEHKHGCGRIYFAGEHTHLTTSATVQAAMESALRVVDEIVTNADT